MTTPLALGFSNPTGVNPRRGFFWVGRDLSVDARTGEHGTLLRTDPGAADDGFGHTIAPPYGMPCFERVDTDGDSVADRLGLRLEADLLSWPFQPAPASMSGVVEFIERGTVGTANAGILYLGNDGVTGGQLFIHSTGTFYEMVHHNGTTAEPSTLAVAPSTGNLVRLAWSLSATGVVQLAQQVNGGAWTTATASATQALPASWGAGSAKLRLNSNGAGNVGAAVFLGCVLDLGVPQRSAHLTMLAIG